MAISEERKTQLLSLVAQIKEGRKVAVSPSSVAEGAGITGPVTKSTGEKLASAAITRTGPGEARTATTFGQEQEERDRSRNLLPGLSEAEAEEFEIVPVGINPDGSVKRSVVPTTRRAVRIKQEEQAGTQSASQEKREVEETTLAKEVEGLIASFGRARKEQGELPLVGEFAGKPGVSRITGVIASIAGGLGLAPATSVFNKKRKAFATVVAKAAGEVRPTDVDIERFLGTLMNPNLTDAENELIMLDLLTKVKEGGDEVAVNIWRQATGKEIGESIPESAQLNLDEASTARLAAIDAELAELKAQEGR